MLRRAHSQSAKDTNRDDNPALRDLLARLEQRLGYGVEHRKIVARRGLARVRPCNVRAGAQARDRLAVLELRADLRGDSVREPATGRKVEVCAERAREHFG
jgi:hypothetical protein